MTAIQRKKQEDDKKTIDSVVARVGGAVHVAGATVDATMKIKDKALDDVEAMRTKSNTKVGNHAIKKIKKDAKRVLDKSKKTR